jgi:hypothetical protein
LIFPSTGFATGNKYIVSGYRVEQVILPAILPSGIGRVKVENIASDLFDKHIVRLVENSVCTLVEFNERGFQYQWLLRVWIEVFQVCRVAGRRVCQLIRTFKQTRQEKIVQIVADALGCPQFLNALTDRINLFTVTVGEILPSSATAHAVVLENEAVAHQTEAVQVVKVLLPTFYGGVIADVIPVQNEGVELQVVTDDFLGTGLECATNNAGTGEQVAKGRLGQIVADNSIDGLADEWQQFLF